MLISWWQLFPSSRSSRPGRGLPRPRGHPAPRRLGPVHRSRHHQSCWDQGWDVIMSMINVIVVIITTIKIKSRFITTCKFAEQGKRQSVARVAAKPRIQTVFQSRFQMRSVFNRTQYQNISFGFYHMVREICSSTCVYIINLTFAALIIIILSVQRSWLIVNWVQDPFYRNFDQRCMNFVRHQAMSSSFEIIKTIILKWYEDHQRWWQW